MQKKLGEKKFFSEFFFKFSEFLIKFQKKELDISHL